MSTPTSQQPTTTTRDKFMQRLVEGFLILLMAGIVEGILHASLFKPLEEHFGWFASYIMLASAVLLIILSFLLFRFVRKFFRQHVLEVVRLSLESMVAEQNRLQTERLIGEHSLIMSKLEEVSQKIEAESSALRFSGEGLEEKFD